MKRRHNDLIGERFSLLTVVRFHDRTEDNHPRVRWWCRCDCGNELAVPVAYLCRGSRRSCGCDDKNGQLTHGRTGTPEWRIWVGMIRRCYHQKDTTYHRYGGRGITVCDRWRLSFVDFLSDMGEIPSPMHTIDRIDNDGNYEPGNCRWATRSVQSLNQRTRKNSTSGIKGITWISQHQRWRVELPSPRSDRQYIGTFKDKQAAITALETAKSVAAGKVAASAVSKSP